MRYKIQGGNLTYMLKLIIRDFSTDHQKFPKIPTKKNVLIPNHTLPRQLLNHSKWFFV
jgi:hypothetical protein